MRSSIIALFFLLSAVSPSKAATKLASKITLKTGFEVLNNLGTSGGSTSGGSGFNFAFTSFLTSELSVGVGYATSFNLTQNTMPTSGYYLQGRYYFMRPGTRVQESASWGTSSMHAGWTPYVGLAYQKNSYYLGSDPLGTKASDSLAGSYSTGIASVGLDYRIDSQFEWNVEGTYSLLTFAASDERIRIQHMGVFFGINFLF